MTSGSDSFSTKYTVYAGVCKKFYKKNHSFFTLWIIKKMFYTLTALDWSVRLDNQWTLVIKHRALSSINFLAMLGFLFFVWGIRNFYGLDQTLNKSYSQYWSILGIVLFKQSNDVSPIIVEGILSYILFHKFIFMFTFRAFYIYKCLIQSCSLLNHSCMKSPIYIQYR